MCSPLVAAGLQAGVQIAGQITEAEGQDEHAKAVWRSAQSDLIQKYNTTEAREQQEMQRTQLQIIQAQKAGMSDTARLRAQAAAGNVGGSTIAERVAQPSVAVSNYTAVAKQNLAMTLQQNQLNAKGFLAQAQSTINETQPANPAALGIDIAGDVAHAATQSGVFGPPGGQGAS